MIPGRRYLNRLGSRIFLTFVLSLLGTTLVFGFLTSHFGAQLLVRSSANELRVLSVALRDIIRGQFSRLEDVLAEISGREDLVDRLSAGYADKKWLEWYLKDSVGSNRQLIDLMIYDLSGRCIGATDTEWYKIRGKTAQFFQSGLKGFNFPPIYGTESMGRVQLVSAPILGDSDEVLGVIVAILDLKDIYDLMGQKIGLNENTDAFLLDSDLQFITAGRTGEKGLVESHLASTTLASHVKDEFWVGEYSLSDGMKVLGTALKISGYSWYVVVERDYKDVLSQISALNRLVFSVTGTLIVFLIVATFVLTRSVTRPLLKLVQSTRKIASGQYSEPVAVSHDIEEIAFIGTELERMRRRVATTQERLKERLTESEQLRVESERLAAIGSLAASLAHEIRNPLNAMSLLLSRLQYSVNEDTRGVLVGDLFGEIGRLDRLVSSILDYARPVQLERRSVDLKTLLLSVADLYRPIAEKKGCEVSVGSIPNIVIQVDPDRLKQCLVNLVKNALDAIDQGGLVQLSAEDHGDQVTIEVFDNGTGIPVALQSKLFTPFFTTKEQGTGLGLSAVHKIVSAHGGKIKVVSDPERNPKEQASPGARFILSIPTI
jgi:signal transduction histidine kinase